MKTRLVLGLMLLTTGTVFAQGEDSTTWERDLLVIDAMLPGLHSNMNQVYFDSRGDRPVKHSLLTLDIASADMPELGEHVVRVAGYRDNDPDATIASQIWSLHSDDEQEAVRMRAWIVGDSGELSAEHCDVYWRRDAAQFRASGNCDDGFVTSLQLGEQELWTTFVGEDAGDYRLHRARPFSCYADIPGVGGGRDIPYKRYGEFKMHDQGAQAEFVSNEGQQLSIMLWLVDWPINNLVGAFTRDSLVVYVSEEIDGESKEHGYAFTLPEADRVGINLKWILVNCYMVSNEDVQPFF